MSKLKRGFLQLFIVIVFIGLGYYGMTELRSSKPQLKMRKPPPSAPVVRTTSIETKSQAVVIHGEGTAKPLKEINLVPQVGGKVIYVSPSVINGGQFKKGDVLLRIDPIDYQLAVTLAEAKVKDSVSKLEVAEEEAEAAKEEWRLIQEATSKSNEKPPPLVAREPQLAAAQARLKADRADLRKAKLNLYRTTLKAPFNGRVSQENVDIGQYVTPGQPLASLYSTDAAEIMVPLNDEDLFWISVPGFTEGDGPGSKAAVRARLGGQERTWHGQVVRAEGKIDERTRMVTVVVRVKNPYAKRPPLAAGLFVKVDIQGKLLNGAALIPRSSLHEGDTVWIVEGNGHLSFRKVKIARVQGESILVESGVKEGESLVISSLKAVTQGMSVQVAGTEGKMDKKPAGPAYRTPDQIIAEIKERLSLTDQQMEEVRPIMIEHIKEQRAIVNKYAGKGLLAARSLGGQMRKLNEKTNERLERILTDEQMSEYLVFQTEQHEKARAAMRPRF